MKAFIIKNKEGEYLDSCQDFETTNICDARLFDNYEEALSFSPKDCEPVEITISEGNLEQELDKAEQELAFYQDEIKNRGTCGLCEKLENRQIKELEQQLAEKDKEIEELEESNGVTKELYKNYYAQLQNYKSKLYGIDIPKLRKKHLTLEEKEIYYKGFENCERQIAANIADITIKVRKQVCDEFKKAIITESIFDTEEEARYWTDDIDVKTILEIIDKIEQAKESMK